MAHVSGSGETVSAYAALQAGRPLQPYRFVPKELGPNDV